MTHNVEGGLELRRTGEHEAGRSNGSLGDMKILKSSVAFEAIELPAKTSTS